MGLLECAIGRNGAFIMVATRSPLYRLESRWAGAALALGLALAVGLWAAWSWREAGYQIKRELSQQTQAAQLPFAIMLENAEGRLKAVLEKPRYVRDGLVRGVADGDAEGIIVAPELSQVSSSLSIPAQQAIANRIGDNPGLSAPFQLDGAWRALLATYDQDGLFLAATIDLERLSRLWGELAYTQSSGGWVRIFKSDGTIWWQQLGLTNPATNQSKITSLIAEIQAAKTSSGVSTLGAIFAAGDNQIAGWRSIPEHRLYVTYAQEQAAVLSCWLGRFPFSLAIAIVLVLATFVMMVRARRLERDRRAAKLLAAESESRLADWAKASADVFWETDTEHKLRHIRSVAADLTPGALAGFYGKTRWQLARVTDPANDPIWAEHIVRINSQRPFRNFEYEIQSRSKGAVLVRVSGEPMFDEAGVFTGYRGVTSDITREQEVERAILDSQAAVAASESLLRAVIDELPATVSFKDLEGRLLIYNKRFAQVFGIDSQSEGVGKRMAEVMSGEMGRAIDARDQIVLDTAKPLELERPAGDYILHIIKYPQVNEAGETVGLVTVGYDITERRAAEQRLSASERRLAHMVELLPAGAVYVEDGRITINAGVEAMTGRSRDELTTLDEWFDKVPVRPKSASRDVYEDEARAGFTRALSFPIRQADGAIRQIEWAAYRSEGSEVWLLRDVTDSYEAEARFKALFERSATGHLICQDSTIKDCNAAALSMLGATSKEQVIDLPLIEISPKAQMDGRLSTDRLAENKVVTDLDGSTRFEWRHLRLDGGTLDVEVVSTKITFGDEPAILVEWHDIADRKAYEAELLRGQEMIERARHLAVERMNDTTQALAGWMWETDSEHRFVFMTESVERLAGVPAEWHYGKTRNDLMATGVQAVRSEVDEVEQAMQAHEPFRDFEFVRVGPDGTDRWLRTSGVPFFDEDGEFQGYRGAAFSIDYEKQLEAERERLMQAAAEAGQRLEQAINAQQSAFALFDSNDRLVACNDAFRGLGPVETMDLQVGDPFAKLPTMVARYLGLKGDEFDAFVAGRMAEHLNDIGPVTRQTTNGRWIISEEHRTSEGGVVGIWTDVTELISAREAAEAASRAKSDFLAMISHEIRTPMNAVLGMASVVLESDLKAEQRSQIQTIQSSGEALLSLINDVLDLSKIEARRIELETEEFSLHGLLDAVLDIGGARAAVKGLEVVAHTGSRMPERLIGDSNRFRQVLLNLVSNAAKFTESGGIRINASCDRQTEADEAIIRIEVHDTGIGIPEDVLEKLFTPFTQADASTTRKYGGTGLGLTISKQLIELMGGRIGVESQPGVGSCFWVEAPFEPAMRGRVPAAEAGDMHWLVIGKESLTRRMVSDGVNDLGGKIEVVEHKHDALGVFESTKVKFQNIIIIDGSGIDARNMVDALVTSGCGQTSRIVVISRSGIGMKELLGMPAIDTVVPAPVRSWRVFNSAINDVVEMNIEIPIEGTPGLTGPFDVLLVEDNRVNQMVATAMLKLGDHRVDIAENGLEAISAVLRKRYDIIFMDMQMPQMDGLDATREIRALDNAAANTPIIAMTANAMLEDRRRCMESGMDDFLSKPIDHAGLNAVMAKWAAVPYAKAPAESTAAVQSVPDSAAPTENSEPSLQGEPFVEDAFVEEDAADNEAALRDLVADLDDLLGIGTDEKGDDPLGSPKSNKSSSS